MVREGRVFIQTPGSGRPAFGQSYYVTAYEPGAQVAQASSGAVATVRAGHGFDAGDFFMVGTDPTRWGQVSVGTPPTTTTITFSTGSISLAEGELLVNLGSSHGGSEIQYDGSDVTIYTDMDYTNEAVGSTVQTDDQGRYRYFHLGIPIWELVRNSSGTPIAVYTYSGTDTNITPTSFNVVDYGAMGDGSTDDYAAVNAANTAASVAGGTVYFPASPVGYRIGTSISFPYNVGLKFDMYAMLIPDLGFTVRIQGPIDAGLYRIFGGTGDIRLTPQTNTELLYGASSIPEAPIQWWGAFPRETADCGPAISAALQAVAPGTFVTFHGGTFKVATAVAMTRKYFNMRGESGGHRPGAGYTTFVWTGADGGTMFTFTNPTGIKLEECSFDGDFSANTVFAAKSDSAGTVSWNCDFERCGFIACRGDALDLGGGHATYNDDFAQALFTQCWFDRPSARTSDADGNALVLTGITAGTHMRIRAWNSYNVKFDNCHFFSEGDSSDADQDARIGINAMGGYLIFDGCMFVNRGIDIYIADPSPGLLPTQIDVVGGESQSGSFIKTYTGTGYTSQRNSTIMGFRHLPSIAGYSPALVNSVYWDGPAYNKQATLTLIGNNFHRNVEIGPNAGWIQDLGTRFAVGYDFTGTVAGIFGILGSRGTTNRAAYGRGLRMGSNIMSFGSTAPTGGLLVGDLLLNHATSDTTLTRDFLQKHTQAASSGAGLGKLTTFYGSHNYEGDCVLNVNGAFDFDPAYAAGVLTLTTKIVPIGNAVYELIWRIGVDDSSTAAKSSQDSGVGHIYIMRDYVATVDSWRIEYVPASTYTNQVGTNLTIGGYLYLSSVWYTSIAYATPLPTTYRLAIKVQTLTADARATFYGIIRRIM